MKGKFMKKIVLVLAVLALAVPAMAGVTVTPAQVGTTNVVTVSYNAPDGNIPRAFALEVTMSPANDTNLAPYGFNSNFYVAPGTFTYDPCTHATSWGNPIVGPNTVKFITEMGSLWDPCDPCTAHRTQPPSSGTLLSFTVSKTCTITLAQNAQRGGVVMEDTSRTFPPGYVTLVTPVTVTVPCTVPNVVGKFESPAMNASNAMTDINNAGFAYARTTTTSATVAAGKVISTVPAAGAQPGCGTTVTCTISTGPATCATCVGDMIADSVQQLNDMATLKAKLVAAYGRTGLYKAIKGDQVTGDQWHICGDLIADNALQLNDMATLKARLVDGYNKGGLYKWPYVPNVVGMTRAAAVTAITAKYLTVNPTDISQCSNTVPAGSVISSNPAYPTYRNCNTSVQLTVSTGPCP